MVMVCYRKCQPIYLIIWYLLTVLQAFLGVLLPVPGDTPAITNPFKGRP